MKKLMVLGLAIFLAGLGLIGLGSVGQGNVSTGGVIFIGPFPIVFGSGPGGWVLSIMSVLIGAVMVLLLLIWGWRAKRQKDDWEKGFK